MSSRSVEIPIALQMYSLRDDSKADFAGALRSTKEIGYDAVEFAGYYGMSSSELRKLLDDLGLRAVGSHVGYDQLRDNLEQVIDYNLEIGAKYIVCPSYNADSRDGWVEFAHFLSSVADTCEKSGLTVGYHNHAHELKKIGDEYIFDIIFDAASDKVVAQLDLGWALYAGVDPVQLLRKYAGRCPLVHVKDFDENNKQTEVGTGALDLQSVVATCREGGVEWMIIETEQYNMEPIDSVRVGYSNLKRAAKQIAQTT